MTMTPGFRKFVLTAHIASTVGWLGAVAAFLALAVVGVTSQDAQMVRAAWIANGLIGWYVILPSALASVLIGVVQSLGTEWGLIRHYWVLVKLLLTIFATIVLLMQMEAISYMAREAVKADNANLGGGGLVVHAGGGLLVLLVIEALSVYKPRGMTPYGWHKQQEERRKRHEERTMLQP